MSRCLQKVGWHSGCGGFLEMHSRGGRLQSAPGGGGRRSLLPRGAAGRRAAAGLQDRAAPRLHLAPRLQIRCAAAAALSSGVSAAPLPPQPRPRTLASRRFLALVRALPAFPRPGSPRPLPLRPRRPRPRPSSGEPFPGGAEERTSARLESGSRASLGDGFSGDKEPGERIH